MRIFKLFLIAIIATTTPVWGQRDLDTAAFNRDVRAQDDLFEHVNGTWLQNTEIPADKSNFGSFIQLDDLSRERIRDLVQELSEATHEKGSDEQKVGDYYRSFMDTQQIAAAGLAPLKAELAKIDGLKSKDDVFEHFGYLQTIGVGSPCGFFVSQDAKDSTRYICQLIQGGISLPDRDYYSKNDEKSEAAREALVDYITKLF